MSMEPNTILAQLKEALSALNKDQRAVTRQILRTLIAELEKEIGEDSLK